MWSACRESCSAAKVSFHHHLKRFPWITLRAVILLACVSWKASPIVSLHSGLEILSLVYTLKAALLVVAKSILTDVPPFLLALLIWIYPGVSKNCHARDWVLVLA